MDWWFNILPLQRLPELDSAEFDGTQASGDAPDPDQEDQVMLQRARLSRIFYRRRFFPYPLQISIRVLRQLGLANTLLVMISYLKSRCFPLKDETFLDAFFINRFGKRLYQTFFKDYTEKVWGIPCEQIRADWGAQRIKGLSLLGAISTAFRDLRSNDAERAQEVRETSLLTRFFYPKYGPGQMWETVADQLRACGGEVKLNRPVSGVELTDGRVTAVTIAGERVPCDYFFSTMPLRHLIQMIEPAPPPAVLEVAAGLCYRDFLTVGLLLRKLRVKEKGRPAATRLPDNWIYIQDGDVRVGRVQCFNNWSPYMVADPEDTVWIGLEYFVNKTDALWQMEDAALIELGTRELEKIEFLCAEDVLDGCVTRMEKAYPMYSGSYERLSELQDWASAVPNLFLIGRNGMHRYNNQDHSMLTAMTAVDNIVAGREEHSNLWQVNVERTYHETRAS